MRDGLSCKRIRPLIAPAAAKSTDALKKLDDLFK